MKRMPTFRSFVVVVLGLALGGALAWGVGEVMMRDSMSGKHPLPAAFHFDRYSRGRPYILLSDKACTYCRDAKVFLAARSIPVTLIELPEDAAADQAIRRVLQVTGTPILIDRTGYWRGFEPQIWARAVK